MLLLKRSSIFCLQEFWLGNKELVQLYEDSLVTAGYDLYKLARPNNRGDGLLTAIKSDRLRVLDYDELFLNDHGDRVAQFFHLQSRMLCEKGGQNASCHQELLLVNTHLLFPHNSNFCLIRLRQVYKLIMYLEQYKMEHKLFQIPALLCGDWNGSKRGHVYKFLRSRGFLSSYDTFHHYTDSDADAHRWVSHRNHRGNICGVDFIWLLNPIQHQKSLSASWKEAIFGIIKAKLQEAGLRGMDAFCFFKSQQGGGDCVTLQEFQQALHDLGLTGYYSEGLTRKEIEDLIQTVDTDGNGVIEYDEFQEMLALKSAGKRCRERVSSEGNKLPSVPKLHNCCVPSDPLWNVSNELPWSAVPSTLQARAGVVNLTGSKVDVIPRLQNGVSAWAIGSGTAFYVKDAFLLPQEVEQGKWPENYSLSDHAPLTATFMPVG